MERGIFPCKVESCPDHFVGSHLWPVEKILMIYFANNWSHLRPPPPILYSRSPFRLWSNSALDDSSPVRILWTQKLQCSQLSVDPRFCLQTIFLAWLGCFICRRESCSTFPILCSSQVLLKPILMYGIAQNSEAHSVLVIRLHEIQFRLCGFVGVFLLFFFS